MATRTNEFIRDGKPIKPAEEELVFMHSLAEALKLMKLPVQISMTGLRRLPNTQTLCSPRTLEIALHVERSLEEATCRISDLKKEVGPTRTKEVLERAQEQREWWLNAKGTSRTAGAPEQETRSNVTQRRQKAGFDSKIADQETRASSDANLEPCKRPRKRKR